MPNQEINTVGLISKQNNESFEKFAKKLVKYLQKRKLSILFDKKIQRFFPKENSFSKVEILQKANLAIVLGGDGTILKTARALPRKKVLILSINLGSLGFISECHPDRAFECLEKIFAKNFTIDKRILLRVTVYRDGRKIATSLALNEAVINQGNFARLIKLGMEINGRKVVDMKGDGLIVSTPTGTTAHSLSAGGPILHPSIEALTITPICPVSLAMRPIVVPDCRQLVIKVATSRRDENSNLGLTVDGQEIIPLQFDDIIKVRRSSRSLYLIRTGDKFYRSLRQKLNWGISRH